MRLITHNMLASNVRGVENGFPLRIEARQVEVKDTEFNAEFLVSMMPKLRYDALWQAAKQLNVAQTLPEQLPDDWEQNEELLKMLHHALLEVHVLEGDLVCPESARKFPIKNGIPNMLLNQDEI